MNLLILTLVILQNVSSTLADIFLPNVPLISEIIVIFICLVMLLILVIYIGIYCYKKCNGEEANFCSPQNYQEKPYGKKYIDLTDSFYHYKVKPSQIETGSGFDCEEGGDTVGDAEGGAVGGTEGGDGGNGEEYKYVCRMARGSLPSKFADFLN